MTAAEISHKISTVLAGRKFLISSQLAKQAVVPTARLPQGIAVTGAYIPYTKFFDVRI